MNLHSLYSGVSRPAEACLLGCGGFGQSFLSQMRRVRLVNARIAVDREAETAAQALLAAGFDRREIMLCASALDAAQAWADGKAIAAATLDAVIDLPFDIMVEATGHPEAAAVHALRAVEAGRHIALVSKELDSVAGPGLHRLAQKRGRLATPVDGDQPSLLINLISWAEICGLDIIAAGKSSEYDFVLDRLTGEVVSNEKNAVLPALRERWTTDGDATTQSAARARILSAAFPLRAVPDLCELTIVANATGFEADRPDLHAPVARIPEVADIFVGRNEGGLLAGEKRLDVFHHFRASDEASFAGGVFVVVRCEDDASWRMLAQKGHAVGASGGAAMLYLPRHLLGLEAATSILDTVGLGQSGYGDDYRPRTDLTAFAERDLAAGAILTASGHHHTIDGVSACMTPAAALRDDRPAPFYLAANRRLKRAVKAGDPIRCGDIEIDETSALLKLRREQDALFSS